MRPTLCPWLLTRGVPLLVDQQFGQRPVAGSTQRRRKARGRTPWFGWRLRRSGTAVRFQATGPGIQPPLQTRAHSQTRASGNRNRRTSCRGIACILRAATPKISPISGGPRPPPTSSKISDSKINTRPPPRRCTNNTDQTDSAKATITVRMPLSKFPSCWWVVDSLDR
jgi:hypothetical protein